jgi:hypothetical protein
MQREQQNKLMDEMFSPLSGRILPASIEERLELYAERNRLEEEKKAYKIIRQKFLNYREFSCQLIKGKTENIDAYALSYSTLPRKRAQGKVEFINKEIAYFNRDEIKFITIEFFNNFFHRSYQNVQELVFNPPSFNEEIRLRHKISASPYDLTPIIVVKEIPKTKVTLKLDTKVYEDTREKLIIL